MLREPITDDHTELRFLELQMLQAFPHPTLRLAMHRKFSLGTIWHRLVRQIMPSQLLLLVKTAPSRGPPTPSAYPRAALIVCIEVFIQT